MSQRTSVLKTRSSFWTSFQHSPLLLVDGRHYLDRHCERERKRPWPTKQNLSSVGFGARDENHAPNWNSDFGVVYGTHFAYGFQFPIGRYFPSIRRTCRRASTSVGMTGLSI